ncbi:MAG: alpha/beta hydrolase [Anaerolineae bacterium]
MKKRLKRIAVGFLVLVGISLIAPYLIPVPDNGVDASTLPQAAEGAFVEVDGIQTFYVERGAQNAQTVLLLHGFGGLTFSWRENIDALAEAGYHVIAFDRPPYGLTEKRADMDLSRAAQTDFTVHLMDALHIETAVMVGHSAGGTVIADMALRYPERIDGLVFVSGAVGTMSGGPSFMGVLLSFPPITRWGQVVAHYIVTPEFMANILRGAYRSPNFMTPEIATGYQTPLSVRGWDAAFIGIMRDSGGNFIDANQLASIDIPTLLVWGQNDTWVPLSIGENLRSIIPGSQIIVYPNVGHLAMEENPEQFNHDLITFLSTINPD